MDVLLSALDPNASDIHQSRRRTLTVSESLTATTFSELVAEAHQLKRRGIGFVNLRRQQILRLGQQRLLEVLDEAQLGVSSLAYTGGFTGSLGMSYQEAVSDTRHALEMASEIGASSVITLTGSKGLHTYRHAERTIREGITECLDDALRYRVNLMIPLTTCFGHQRDVFEPESDSCLDWISSFQSHRIRPMMLLRGDSPWNRVPDCWKRCLKDGGLLRISRDSEQALGTTRLLSTMLESLSSERSRRQSERQSLAATAIE